ncbi:hypothetical protein CEXT_645561 [Caerostris extrusa]|uniref:Ribosomal protein S14 n=1 Tax=Caerostris extrusa TaxID=172846 RepID=A0AAV4MHZ0_CAEEX|nr:hypothetical protein CEXT_645561 [Caerostris extrusa]
MDRKRRIRKLAPFRKPLLEWILSSLDESPGRRLCLLKVWVGMMNSLRCSGFICGFLKNGGRKPFSKFEFVTLKKLNCECRRRGYLHLYS